MLRFRWNDWDVRHIDRHGVTPEEAEYVARHPSGPFPQRREDGKYLVWGRTQAGRYFQVIYVFDAVEEEDDDDDNTMHELDLLELLDAEVQVVYVIHDSRARSDGCGETPLRAIPERTMKNKRSKPLTRMNTAELARATAEFDKPMVIDTFRPVSAGERAAWRRATRRDGRAETQRAARFASRSRPVY